MGDFDLSVSGMVAVSSAVIVATVVRTDIPWGIAVILALLVALVVGAFNGWLVAYVGTPSFITTLASGVILAGHLYSQDFDRDSNTIEVFIGRLRKKIPAQLIRTVRGLGYCLSDEDEG